MRRAVLACLLVAMPAMAGRGKERKAYLAEYRDHTEALVIYNDFTTSLILRGTLLDDDFRDSLAGERQRLIDPLPDDQERFVSRSDRDLADYHEVVFSADSAEDGKLRFGPGDDRWNVRLTADGELQELVTVYRVRNPTPLQQSLFPHYNLWSTLWIARFSKTVADPREVVFHVGSGFGHGELVFTHEE